MCGHTRPTWPIRHFSGQPDQRLLLPLNEEYRSIASEIDTIQKQIESFMAGKAWGFAAERAFARRSSIRPTKSTLSLRLSSSPFHIMATE
jgi:hypothetical protein